MAEVVAGLVLGGLPIAIELAKSYRTLSRTYAKYRRCGEEVEEFKRRLKVEETTFCTEIQILLASSIGYEEANRVLTCESDGSPLDEDIDKLFRIHLGVSETACFGIMMRIKLRLEAIELFIGKCAPVSGQFSAAG
jgi:hypothetical protein